MVVVGWNDSVAHVSSVTDSQGNVYTLAVGPTVRAGFGSQSIFFARNIPAAAAGSNAVTVAFDQPANYVDLRIAEYQGLDPVNPVDVVAAASGSSSTSNSGNATTTSASDLLVGANLVSTLTTAPGTSYTSRRITSPDGDILEDRTVTATGSYSATASLWAGSWIMQMVAFRAALGGPVDTQAPTAPSGLLATAASGTQINLSWTASTDNVGVTSYLIERCQGSGCTTFAQVGTATGTTFGNTGLTSGASYSYRVRATDAAGNFSSYSNTASATTPDTQAPTVPGGIGALATSTSQIAVTWTASTDNVAVTGYRVERCQGAGCTTFVQVGTPTTPGFNDSGLSANTSYSYRVRATDAAGNLSGYSAVASATTQATPDTQAPTVPANVNAAAVSSSQISVTWNASTDNVGVTGYRVERCQGAGCTTFGQVGTPTGTSFTDAGLSASTSYSYRVRATDAAGNLSGFSTVASATTPAAAAPIAFVQVNYAAPQTAQTSVSVPFTAAQGAGHLNVVVVGWNDATRQVLTVSDTKGNAYLRAVGPTVQAGTATQSIYYAANIAPAGANGNTVTVTFDGAARYADVRIAEYAGIDPANPVDGVAAAQGSGTSSNSGLVATTNANDLLVGANLVQSLTTGAGASFTSRIITTPDRDILEDRIVATAGSYNATASMASGAWIMQLVAFRGGSGVPDTQAPTVPGGVGATATSSSQISVLWTASTDNVGVTGYRVERCQGTGCTTFAQVGTPGTPSFGDTGLTAGTSYSYRVRAADAAGNLSGYSTVASATTQSPDTEPPSAPGTLTATVVSGTQVDLSWGPATDNVGVTGYRVERCQGVGCTVFVKLATPTLTTFSDTGLTPNTAYSYIVRASDGAGNLGAYSNQVNVTTSASVPELVAAFSFNEGTGATALDQSGTGNNASIGNATWTTAGKFGRALSFNGSNALVSAPDSLSLDLTNGMTLEAWVNPSVVNSGWRDVIYKGNDNYYLESTSSPGGFPAAGVTLGSGATGNAYGTALLPLGTWTHLAETYDGATLRLYVNGVQVSSAAVSGPLRTSTNPLEIGGDHIFGQYFQRARSTRSGSTTCL